MSQGLIDKRNRMRSIFNRLDSRAEGSDIAFRIADKALQSGNLSWTHLLDAHYAQLDRPQEAQPSSTNSAPRPHPSTIPSDCPHLAAAMLKGADLSQIFTKSHTPFVGFA